MVDTNVMMDILENRNEYFDDSYLVVRNAIENGDKIMYPVSATTDIAYILRKRNDVREKLTRLSCCLQLADVRAEDFFAAMRMNMNDFEDALLSAVAKRNRAEYIVTRNKKDFADSVVQAVTPKEFLDIIMREDV
ncbi:MAG: PIN domain-containing protein [Clostridia bacterium]|nr:PIN domain-containing protein [Clostridia bacterium]